MSVPEQMNEPQHDACYTPACLHLKPQAAKVQQLVLYGATASRAALGISTGGPSARVLLGLHASPGAAMSTLYGPQLEEGAMTPRGAKFATLSRLRRPVDFRLSYPQLGGKSFSLHTGGVQTGARGANAVFRLTDEGVGRAYKQRS